MKVHAIVSMTRPAATRMRCALLSWMLLIVSAAPSVAQEEQPPRLLNADRVERAARSVYPAELASSGVASSVVMRAFVNHKGGADSLRLHVSSGVTAIDRVSVEAAREAKFAPAERDGSRVTGWIEFPVEFTNEKTSDRFVPPPPRLVNRDDVLLSRHEFYPEAFRPLRLGARVTLALVVDQSGRVVKQTLVHGSCLELANEKAQELAATFRFEPASAADFPARRSYASIFITADSMRFRVYGDTIPRDTVWSNSALARGGKLRKPDVINRGDARAALLAAYPPALRRAGITGQTLVSMYIDERGELVVRLVDESSGYCELDRAALTVTEVMRFRPAVVDGVPTATWVEIPIVFNVNDPPA